jgi:poly(A) polymerase
LPLLTSNIASEILGRLTRFFSVQQPSTYLVGGYLRDSLLSLSSHDIDIAVAGDAHALGRALAEELRGVYVPLTRAFNVARIVVQTPTEETWNIDLAGFYGTIEEDLVRRDFTVNSLALPLPHWLDEDWRPWVVDPRQGLIDLSNQCIRATTPHVFQDDPGRLVRAVRLASRLRFRLDPETARLVRANAPEIQRVSPERVRDEFLAILAGDGARSQLEVLDRLDLLCRIIPELAVTKGVDQPRVHYWDVWGHLMHSVETAELVTKGHQHSAIYFYVPWTPDTKEYFSREVSDGHTRRTMLKLTALLHDIAKPQTKSRDDTGRIRFFGHSELGAEMAAERLAQLRVGSRGIAMVSKMVEQHLRPANMHQGLELPTHRAIYRYFRDLGDVAVDTLYLAMADYLAAKGPELVPDDWGNHARIMAYILQVGTQQTSPDRPDRLVTGHDLIEQFDLEPGPQIGILLETINEARAAGEISSREEALALAEQALNSQKN